MVLVILLLTTILVVYQTINHRKSILTIKMGRIQKVRPLYDLYIKVLGDQSLQKVKTNLYATL